MSQNWGQVHIDAKRSVKMRDDLSTRIVYRVKIPGAREFDSLLWWKLFADEVNAIVTRVSAEFCEFAFVRRLVRLHLTVGRRLKLAHAFPIDRRGVHQHFVHRLRV